MLKTLLLEFIYFFETAKNTSVPQKYIVKNLASFNDQNKKLESSVEIYRDQSLV